MSDIVKNAANGIITSADDLSAHAVNVVKDAVELAQAGATAPINVAGKTLDAALTEVDGLRSRLFNLLQEISNAVTGPLP